MKTRLTTAAILFSIVFLFNSCYKTGEIIYQRKCGLVSFNMQTDKLWNRNFYPAGPNTDMNASIAYANIPYITRRTTRITENIADVSQPMQHIVEFSYDNNGNMNLIRSIYLEVLPPNTPYPPTGIVDDYVITYPDGTTNSASNTFKIQRSSETFSGQVDSPYTYTFNNELQLTSITDYYNNMKQTFEYDFGGNCTKNTLYGANNTIAAVWEYSGYDDKINPCRTDRTLQLYYNVYSKNNPTNVKLTVYDDKGGVQTYNNTYSYTYNSDNYASGIVGFIKPYANYICPIP